MSAIALPPGMAPGFRFHPTDEELITCYLKPKILGTDSNVDGVIAEVNLCKLEPWDLPSKSKIKSKDRMWVFFCVQNFKYVSSKERKLPKKSSKKGKSTETGMWKITAKRTTKAGFWKITGEEHLIKDEDTKECIGKKRNLVFHIGRNPGQRTNWVMQQYYIEPLNPLPNQKTYVLCRVKKKANNKANTTLDCDVPSGDITSEVENPVTPTATSQAHGNEEVNQESLTQPLYSPVRNLTDEDISLPSPIGLVRNHNEMQDCYGAGATEESPEEIMNRLLADPDADQDPKYNGETTCFRCNECSLQTSWKRVYFGNGNGLVGSDTDTEGVNGRAKKPRSLALGQSFQ